MTTITVDVSALVDGNQADASDVATPIANLKTGVENALNGVQKFDQINLGAPTDLTLASDAITITKSFHRVDTEAAAASDNLSTINGGVTGDILFLRQVNASRDVTIKHNVGNILMTSGVDFNFQADTTIALLIFTGAVWIKI